MQIIKGFLLVKIDKLHLFKIGQLNSILICIDYGVQLKAKSKGISIITHF